MLRHATFRQLNALQAVARSGSVSRAAQELNLSQPAVTQQLRQLEDAAGAALVQRLGRGIQLTTAGTIVAGYASRILELLEQAGEELLMERGAVAGTLRVGAVTTAEYLLPAMLVRFTADHPRIHVRLQVGNRDDMIRQLALREIDVAIMGRPPRELKTVAQPFASHPMAFLAAPGHPLNAAPEITLAALRDANLLVRERGSGTRATLDRMYRDAGMPLRVGSEMNSNEAIKQMAVAGLGVAFVSMHTCVLEMQTGLLRLVALPGNPIVRQWYVMHLADKQLSAVATAFREYLVERGQADIDRQLGGAAVT